MAKRYADTGLELVRSGADEQVWLPKAASEFVEVTEDDLVACADRLRVAREVTQKRLMDDEGGKWEFRWVKVDGGARWKLQEREKE